MTKSVDVVARPSRIVSIAILGRPPRRTDRNVQRAELLSGVVRGIRRRRDWDPIDALVFPAGFFRIEDRFGPLDHYMRVNRVLDHDFARVCQRAVRWLTERSPGVVLIVGVDTPRMNGRWNGDQMSVAFDGLGVRLCTRKVFPAAPDTNGARYLPLVVYKRDGRLRRRTLRLASGALALVSVCYDAFLWQELAGGPTAKRNALKFLAGKTGDVRKTSPRTRAAFFERLAHERDRIAPTVHLIPIHGFRKPGTDVYWQRHGLATASAAFDGALAVGAAHFREALPVRFEQSPLAAKGVDIGHLTAAHHRTAQRLAPLDGFLMDDVEGLPALVRLFEA